MTSVVEMSAEAIGGHGNSTLHSVPLDLEQRDRLGRLMREVITEKENKKNTIETDRKSIRKRFNCLDLNGDFWLVGGDIFSIFFLGFQSLQNFIPSVASYASVQLMTGCCGIVAGVINICVGISCCIQGVKELKKRHHVVGLRLVVDGVLMIGIGVVMILAPVLLWACKISILAICPYLLPVLFGVLSCLIMVELIKYTGPIWQGTDLGTRLMNKIKGVDFHNEQQVNGLLEEFLFTGEDMHNIVKEKQAKEVLCLKMDQFEGQVGVTAAIEVYRFMTGLLDLSLVQKDSAKRDEQIAKVESLLNRWKRIQYVRLLQQMLYIGATIVTGSIFIPGTPINLINGLVNFCMMLANAIPLYMDWFWPFERNVPVVVAGVQVEEIAEAEQVEGSQLKEVA